MLWNDGNLKELHFITSRAWISVPNMKCSMHTWCRYLLAVDANFRFQFIVRIRFLAKINNCVRGGSCFAFSFEWFQSQCIMKAYFRNIININNMKRFHWMKMFWCEIWLSLIYNSKCLRHPMRYQRNILGNMSQNGKCWSSNFLAINCNGLFEFSKDRKTFCIKTLSHNIHFIFCAQFHHVFSVNFVIIICIFVVFHYKSFVKQRIS